MPFKPGESGNVATQFQPGQSGNPAGKPVGSKHLATYIQEMMWDDDFTAWLSDPHAGVVEFKGSPVKAIVGTALKKAAVGDDKAREWLAKYGYGTKQEIEHTGAVNTGISDPKLAAEFTEFLKQRTKE